MTNQQCWFGEQRQEVYGEENGIFHMLQENLLFVRSFVFGLYGFVCV